MAGAALPSTEMVAAAVELGCSLRPGFRFHPTDQELVGWFLTSKVLGHGGLHIDFIPEVNAYRFEPHELPAKSFSPSTADPRAKVEWYFFAPRGRKYPTGFRMERATLNGFWKSTGKDRPIMHNGTIIGMKKTLVFHTGRAPRGTRTDWVMHEYRLHDDRNHHIQDTYALCRVFTKNMVTPSTDVSGGADADEHPMQFMPGGVDTHKDLMEYVLCATDVGNDAIQFESEGDDSNKDPMQSVLGGVGTNKDPIQIESESDGAADNVGKDLMQSVLGGGGTDKDPIQVDSDSDSADTNKYLMQFLLNDISTDKDPILVESEFDGVYTNKGKRQICVHVGADANKDGTQFVHVGTEANKEGMLPVTSGADADEDKSDNTWHTDALTEECNSLMQFCSDDVWYTRVDVDKDDSLMQFIFSDVWLLSAD